MPIAWTFSKDAEARGMTPANYALQLVLRYGNVAEAARRSGYQRWTLTRHLKLAGIATETKRQYVTRIVDAPRDDPAETD